LFAHWLGLGCGLVPQISFQMGSRRVEVTSLQTVLARHIDWEALSKPIAMIEEADVALFRDFDKAPQADQHALIEEHAEAYAQAFVRALQNITNEDILQYILAVLSELIDSLQEPRNPFIKSLGTLGGFRALFAYFKLLFKFLTC